MKVTLRASLRIAGLLAHGLSIAKHQTLGRRIEQDSQAGLRNEGGNTPGSFSGLLTKLMKDKGRSAQRYAFVLPPSTI